MAYISTSVHPISIPRFKMFHQSLFLCPANKNSLNSIALSENCDTVFWNFDIKVKNFWSSHQLYICGATVFACSKSISLRCLYWGHLMRKCFSSSIIFGQNGQKRWSRSIPMCLPFSIISRWLESLNLLRAVRSFTGISSRYFSNPDSSFNLQYVLNLLSTRFISSKACWWKISESLWNDCRCT